MALFDRETVLSLAENASDKTVFISGESIALILVVSGVLENRRFWENMTDSEWDGIEALIADLLAVVI